MKIASAVLVTSVLAGLVLTPLAARAEVESKDPIKIALFDWTSVNLNAKILGGILEKLGYTVEYPTADYLSSLTTGLTNGDLTIGVEYWDTTAGEAMKASDQTKQTERLGKLGPKAKEEWWYPALYEGKMPGPPQLGSAQGSEMRRSLLYPRNRAEGPLSRRAGDLGRI